MGTLYQPRSVDQLEENLKKALCEMLVLKLLTLNEMFVGDITEALREKSGGALSIQFPYAIIYRMLDNNYIIESGKRIAPDGRRRQYFRITDEGRGYLNQLLQRYRQFMGGVEKILAEGGKTVES